MSAKTVEARRASLKRKLKLKIHPELTRHAGPWVKAVRQWRYLAVGAARQPLSTSHRSGNSRDFLRKHF